MTAAGRTLLGLAAAAVLVAAVPAAAHAAPQRARWDTRLLATVPSPGYPALAYVHPDGRIYEGTYDNPNGDHLPSRVFEYSADGHPLRSWTVPGQDLSGPHGVQVATSDARGRLLLLDLSPARALMLDVATGTFTPYATFANLPLCAPATTGPSCSPALRDEPPEPDYAAWLADGSLLVTDYQQAVIWRVPPGGGAARVWLADRRLDGDMFGTAGIVLTADLRSVLVTQASSAGGAAGNPTTGSLYRIDLAGGDAAGTMRRLWESRPGDLPDGFAVARSGNVYIALVGLPNQLVMLSPAGAEVERFPRTPGSGDNGSPEPFDNPSSARFAGTRLIVPNQSYVSGNPRHWTLLDVETGEEGAAEFIPATAGEPPAPGVPPAPPTSGPAPPSAALPSTGGVGSLGPAAVLALLGLVAAATAGRRRRR